MMMFDQFIRVVGIIATTYYLLYKPIRLLYALFRNNFDPSMRAINDRILRATAQDYAIITGATAGIGLEYARQLSEKGYNLLLLARNEQKLKQVATEIRRYPQSRKVDYLVVDFADGDKIYSQISEKINTLNGTIHVLVNNVGILHHIPEYFAQYAADYHRKLIEINIAAATMMCAIVVPRMQRQPIHTISAVRGVIINLSSASGFVEMPLFSTYAASKAYVTFLSNALSAELAQDRIVVQTVTPNQVDTAMASDIRSKLVLVNAKSFVYYALRTVGVEQQTNGHPRHKLINSLLLAFARLMPVEDWIGTINLKGAQHVRRDYDRRKQHAKSH